MSSLLIKDLWYGQQQRGQMGVKLDSHHWFLLLSSFSYSSSDSFILLHRKDVSSRCSCFIGPLPKNMSSTLFLMSTVHEVLGGSFLVLSSNNWETKISSTFQTFQVIFHAGCQTGSFFEDFISSISSFCSSNVPWSVWCQTGNSIYRFPLKNLIRSYCEALSFLAESPSQFVF